MTKINVIFETQRKAQYSKIKYKIMSTFREAYQGMGGGGDPIFLKQQQKTHILSPEEIQIEREREREREREGIAKRGER